MLVLLLVRVGGKGEQLDPAASDVHTSIGAVTTRGLQHRVQTAFLVNLSTAENNMNKTSAQTTKETGTPNKTHIKISRTQNRLMRRLTPQKRTTTQGKQITPHHTTPHLTLNNIHISPD
jgi:hypothetical protein